MEAMAILIERAITTSVGKLVGGLRREEAVRLGADRTACTRSLITSASED
jgi:hypothetical protein